MILFEFLTSVCLGVSLLAQLVVADPGISESVRSAAIDLIGKITSAPKDVLHAENDVFLSSLTSVFTQFLNSDEDVIEVPRYRLFTGSHPNEDYNLEPTSKSIDDSSFDSDKETKFLVHGWNVDLPKSSVYFDLVSELIREGSYNVILVDWTKSNKDEYPVVALRVPIIGFYIANLIQSLAKYKGISANSVHIIGHSLGAQVTSYAGKATSNLGRITGLDAAGPGFQYLPEQFRLSHTDAIFVDAIHTNGEPALFLGYGTLLPYGDLDFLPNGGSIQPGCYNRIRIDAQGEVQFTDTSEKRILCNHERSLFLYLASIHDCRFKSVFCGTYDDFKRGKCPPETSVVSDMGFHAKPIPSVIERTKFYLNTNDQNPYCISTS